jgi:hypothetical protein
MAVVIASAMFALSIAPAFAHHSWTSQDTRYAYYLSGTITDVRWGNPHVEVLLKLGQREVPDGFAARPLPPGADERDGRLSMQSARAYTGRRDVLRLTLAPPEYMARWGLNRRLKVGERIEAVGFLNTQEPDEIRPVMFWLADGQGVWQKLLAFPYPPEPATSAAATKR